MVGDTRKVVGVEEYYKVQWTLTYPNATGPTSFRICETAGYMKPSNTIYTVHVLELVLAIFYTLILHYTIHGTCILYMHNCDRLRQNPAYGIYAQLAQCAFSVPQVSICQTSVFVMFIFRNLPSTCYRHLRRLNVSY